MEISDVRRRLLHTIERTRRAAAERRGRADAAARAYERFLADVATPVFRMFAQALNAEGHRFKLATPAESVRLVSERSPDDFIELGLDTSRDPASVVGRTGHARGRRTVSIEEPIRDGAAIEDLTDEDVLQFLLRAVEPFVER